MQNLKIKKLNPNAILPTRSNALDAGLDLYALEDCFVEQLTTKIVKTGIGVSIPDGYVGKIEDRSGMASKGLRTGGGVIDAGFQGEVGVIIHNLTSDRDIIDQNPEDTYMDYTRGYKINKGDRIAQILVYKVEILGVEEVDEFDTKTDRGTNGYGSTGI